MQFNENGRIIYKIDRFDYSFLKDGQLIDPKTFDFNSDIYKKAVAETLRRQEEIDSIPRFRYPAGK